MNANKATVGYLDYCTKPMNASYHESCNENSNRRCLDRKPSHQLGQDPLTMNILRMKVSATNLSEPAHELLTATPSSFNSFQSFQSSSYSSFSAFCQGLLTGNDRAMPSLGRLCCYWAAGSCCGPAVWAGGVGTALSRAVSTNACQKSWR